MALESAKPWTAAASCITYCSHRSVPDGRPGGIVKDSGTAPAGLAVKRIGPRRIGTGLSVTRTTIETLDRPGRGSRLELSFDTVGPLGGDIDFNRVNVDYTVLLTITEDFLGRRSVLRLNSQVGYIFGGRAPVYERFYLGGRSFRGFDFRTVSPKGIRNDTLTPGDDPVGGSWKVFFGAQYEMPLVQDSMALVVFVDSGTVIDDPGFDDYRVSIGVGLRLFIPAFGQVPLAFDFATPIQKEDQDETQVFSFTAELPF